jgi:hypothetical protein
MTAWRKMIVVAIIYDRSRSRHARRGFRVHAPAKLSPGLLGATKGSFFDITSFSITITVIIVQID